jgi:hypothetical protein
MTKKVIIPDEIYKSLRPLAVLCKQDVDDVIVEILKAVGSNNYDITKLRESYRVPMTLEQLMKHILEAGVDSIEQLYDKVLEHLGVKGLYWFEDRSINEIDLEGDKIRIVYDAHTGAPDFVARLDFETDGRFKTLSTDSYMDLEEVSKEAVSKLKRLVKEVDPYEEFDEPEDVSIEVVDDIDMCYLKMFFEAATFDQLPTVARISSFVKKLFAKAGID